MFKAIIFALLCCQTSCYLQQSVCTSLTFGKCMVGNYCEITDTGAYTCLPCPAGNLCPGDGHTYSEQQLNKHLHNMTKYNIILTSHFGRRGYIVSSDPANRKLFRKKFKKFIKIAKIGLKVAAIVKTGGTAGIAKLAAAKAKQLAIKKGLQCLKNGLSNFCNGKKKGAKPKPKIKPRIGSAGALVKRVKPAVISQSQRRKPVISGAVTKPSPAVKPNPSKTSVSRTRTNSRKTKPLVKGKGKGKGKRPSKNSVTKPPTLSTPCSNVFDDFANKVNNVTNNLVKNPVNNGRDWLKRNIGGNKGSCNQQINERRPTNLRGQTTKPKPSPKTKPTTSRKRRPKPKPTSTRKRRPTKTKSKPRSGVNDDTVNPPVSNDDTTNAPVLNDDSRPIIKTRPATKSKSKPKAKIITTRSPSNDDAIVLLTRRPVRQSIRRQTRRPTQISISTVDTPRPSRRRVRRTRRPIKRPTRRPSQTFVVTDDGAPTPRPSRRRVRRTRRPTGSPLSVSTPRPSVKKLVRTSQPTSVRKTRLPTTTMPTFVLTIGPTRRPTPLPSIRPTRTPTPAPSRIPSVKPTPNPTRVPTVRPTPNPTRVPTVRPSSNPTLLPSAAIAGPPTMIPGISWSVFSSAPTTRSNIPPTLVPTISMFTMITQMPTPRRTIRPTASPSLLKAVSQQASPTIRPNTEIPTVQPSVQPTFTPSFRPSPIPSLAPSQEVIKTLSPTASGVGVSSINSASTSERNGITSTAIGVGVGCIVILLIIVCACIFVTKKKSKEKLSPYQVWTDYYAGKPQEKQINSKEDIHHFYSKSPRPSFNQNTVFTPHVSGRISSRNSQILSPVGSQKNMQRLSFSKGPALHNNF